MAVARYASLSLLATSVVTVTAYRLPSGGSAAFGVQHHTVRRATLPRLDAAAEGDLSAEAKRLKAEKLKLQAEIADVEARQMSLESVKSRAEPLPAAPAAPAPPAETPPSVAVPPGTPPSLAQLYTQVADTAADRLDDFAPLQELLGRAWQQSRLAQQAEIVKLRRQIDQAVLLQGEQTPDEEKSFGEALTAAKIRTEEQQRTDRQTIKIDDLVQLSENRTSVNVAESRASERALTRSVFKLFKGLTQFDEAEAEAGDAVKVPVPGEGLVAIDSSRVRLRLLERHEAADCVEYRHFASALADVDELTDLTGTPTGLEGEDVAGNITALFGRWAKLSFNDEAWQELLEAEDDEEVRAKLENTEGTDLPVWLEKLADLLTRSAKGGLFTPDELDLEDISEDFSLFPILLGGLAFRQGNLELFTIYYLARVLARINLQTMAVYQGRDAPINPDVLVSQQEALIVKQTTDDVIGLFGVGFLLTTLISFALSATLVYQVISALLALFGIGGEPPDPLAF